MRFLFASDSFKGSLTSREIWEMLAETAEEVFPGCETIGAAVADGGEGTVEALCKQTVKAYAVDPLGRPVECVYGIYEDHAVIEMAQASGLTLLGPDERDPMITSSYGTGQLIVHALDRGYRKIDIGIGGSATNDGGMGCMRALGFRFLDASGRELAGRGEDLVKVREIDGTGADKRLKATELTVMSDVDNPLCGPDGAAMTYGAQKGGDEESLALLEAGMANYRDVIKKAYGIDCDTVKGAGAAGGLGAALAVLAGGRMASGIDHILDMVGFDEKVRQADIVITGEGRTDAQSCHGKVICGVGRRARKYGVPVIGLSGSMGPGGEAVLNEGITAVLTTVDRPMDTDEAMAEAPKLYRRGAYMMFRMLKAKEEMYHDQKGIDTHNINTGADIMQHDGRTARIK